MAAHSPAHPDDVGYQTAMALRALLRAGRHMQAAMGQQLALGDTDLNAMDELSTADQPMGPVELGNRLGIRSASATMLVDRLEQAGLVRREPHPSDRRRITLRTTEESAQAVRDTLAPLIRSVTGIVAALDPDEARVVLQFLREVTDVVRHYPSP